MTVSYRVHSGTSQLAVKSVVHFVLSRIRTAEPVLGMNSVTSQTTIASALVPPWNRCDVTTVEPYWHELNCLSGMHSCLQCFASKGCSIWAYKELSHTAVHSGKKTTQPPRSLLGFHHTLCCNRIVLKCFIFFVLGCCLLVNLSHSVLLLLVTTCRVPKCI